MPLEETCTTPAPKHQGTTRRRLNEAGKVKVRQFVNEARTIDELAEIEEALDAGLLNEDLAARLHLTDVDFQQVPRPLPTVPSQDCEEPPKPIPTVPTQSALPLGALGLTASGMQKVRQGIESATNLQVLAILDAALTHGDIPKLREMLDLQPEDLSGLDDEHGEALTEPSDDGIADEEEDDDYDPFATEPTKPQPIEDKPTPQVSLPTKKEMSMPSAKTGLSVLQSAYEDSDSDVPAEAVKGAESQIQAVGGIEALNVPSAAAEVVMAPPTKKQRKSDIVVEEQPKVLSWPKEWAWLMIRTQRHLDFRPPPLLPDSCRAQAASTQTSIEMHAGPFAVAIATSLVYVGDVSYGYDPRHLARVVAVDDCGKTLLDVIVKPRATLLDCRTHLTGLTREMFEAEAAEEFDVVCSKLLKILKPQTLLVGYRLNSDLEALRFWHGPLIDIALLFGVDSRKKNQYHTLGYIAEHVLQIEIDERKPPYDALEAAQVLMRLAQHEVKQSIPTAPFAPKVGNACELMVRHIPSEWDDKAAARIGALINGAQQNVVVNWSLNETDPTDRRGDTVLVFPSSTIRDSTFDALQGLTDVFVQWDDVPPTPGFPPLGAILTEQSLIQAFSRFGVVIAARLPKKPITREPQTYAFVSFLLLEDAQRAAKKSHVEVQIIPTWTIFLRSRLAKHGHMYDKRLAVKSRIDDGGDGDFDWIHVSKN